MIRFLFIPLFVVLLIVLRYIIFFALRGFRFEKTDLASISLKDLLFEWIIVTAFLTCLTAVVNLFTTASVPTIVMFVIAILSASVFVSYSFIVRPILDAFSKNKFQEAPNYENWIKQTFGYSVKVRIVEKNIINAYATGVVPFSKLILLGAPLIQKMNEEEIKGLLSHEMGHTVKNHLLILYLLNILNCIFIVISSLQLIPIFEHWNYTPMWVALHGGFWGLIMVLITGLGQRKLEKAADLFAAHKIGIDNYAGVLTKLDQLTNGGLSQKSINYPTLKQRIEHIEKYFLSE